MKENQADFNSRKLIFKWLGFFLVIVVLGYGIYINLATYKKNIELGNSHVVPTEFITNLCLDHLGQPQNQESCANIPESARICQKKSDCYPTCSHGCLSREWKSETPLIDCSAEPTYNCDCIDNVCQKDRQITECGGWDTSGEIICECNGKIIKPTCSPGAICDSASYKCEGQCGECCYKGTAENTKYPKCGQ